ncbi:serine/threonine-protein kinase [Nocardia crassostreae]|uniref:serine/threonine-protein kinase n=1 Tax=Nocardia crassostreae TaxID=53428 RepID=UPI000836FEEA|nr:serine/threonine-protein kinase [Nocardia crassostreae]
MLLPGEVFADYLIERQLGSGGMAEVYLARHPRLPRQVALKLLGSAHFSNSEIRARFEREANLVARLDHPNIVSVFDTGIFDYQLWMSMQYIDGTDTEAIDYRTLAPEHAVHIIAETAKALDYAHTVGVLHRDVKPANIMLARPWPGHGARVLLTDFGIGRFREDTQSITPDGTLMATLGYASPEQLNGASLDARSDQYTLACTLFRLLSGSTPFAANNLPALINGHLQAPPPSICARRPGLPLAMDRVIWRALAKNPADRFGSCAELAAAAAAALTPTTATAAIPGPRIPVRQLSYGRFRRPSAVRPRPGHRRRPRQGAGSPPGSSASSSCSRWRVASTGRLVTAVHPMPLRRAVRRTLRRHRGRPRIPLWRRRWRPGRG